MKKTLIAALLFASFVSNGTAFADAQSLSENVQGAESETTGSVNTVRKHAQDVFKQLGISQTGASSKSNGNQQTLTGKNDDVNVEVTLNATDKNLTHVGVVAKQGALHWNKDYAKNVLSKVVQTG